MFIAYCIIFGKLYLDGLYNQENASKLVGLSIMALILSNVIFHVIVSFSMKLFLNNKGSDDDDGVLDERDEAIELKGIRTTYVIFGMSFLVSMAFLTLGSSYLVVINLVALSIIVAEIAGGFQKLHHYRKGF